MNKRVGFSSGNLNIEGMLSYDNEKKGVVITHPHPLYGGNMYNFVVESIHNAYRKKDYATLRFNFRGVGKSQGEYGEGDGEKDDVMAAIAFLKDLGIEKTDLAGYSFGAWVNAMIDEKKAGIDNMIMVSPPVALLDFDNLAPISCLSLVVTGEKDDIAPPDSVKSMVKTWNPHAGFEVIPATDHFYGVTLRNLEKIIENHIDGR